MAWDVWPLLSPAQLIWLNDQPLFIVAVAEAKKEICAPLWPSPEWHAWPRSMDATIVEKATPPASLYLVEKATPPASLYPVEKATPPASLYPVEKATTHASVYPVEKAISPASLYPVEKATPPASLYLVEKETPPASLYLHDVIDPAKLIWNETKEENQTQQSASIQPLIDSLHVPDDAADWIMEERDVICPPDTRTYRSWAPHADEWSSFGSAPYRPYVEAGFDKEDHATIHVGGYVRGISQSVTSAVWKKQTAMFDMLDHNSIISDVSNVQIEDVVRRLCCCVCGEALPVDFTNDELITIGDADSDAVHPGKVSVIHGSMYEDGQMCFIPRVDDDGNPCPIPFHELEQLYHASCMTYDEKVKAVYHLFDENPVQFYADDLEV